MKLNLTVDSFRSPDEPYLVYEDIFDNMTHRMDRRVRRSPLAMDKGIADQKLIYHFEQRDINNTHIMRGFNIIVRDYNGTVISDEYGMKGPFEDSRTTDGKVMWYRPHDNMHPNYTEGEELDRRFKMPRPARFKIDNFDDKRAVYF